MRKPNKQSAGFDSRQDIDDAQMLPILDFFVLFCRCFARLIVPPAVTRSFPFSITLETVGRLVPLALCLTIVTGRRPLPRFSLRSFGASFFCRYNTSS